MTPAPWLISYDIADPKRLRRVEKAISGVGVRVHYSLFYCELTMAELNALQRRLKQCICVDADTVQYTPWCDHDRRLTKHMGTSKVPDVPASWIV